MLSFWHHYSLLLCYFHSFYFSWICVSSLHRGQSNLLCVISILVYGLPKWAQFLIISLFIYFTSELTVSPPSPRQIILPISPLFPPSNTLLLLFCLGKCTEIPWALAKHGISICSKTKHYSLYYGWARQLIMRNRVPKFVKELETVLVPSVRSHTQEDQVSQLWHIGRVL